MIPTALRSVGMALGVSRPDHRPWGSGVRQEPPPVIFTRVSTGLTPLGRPCTTLPAPRGRRERSRPPHGFPRKRQLEELWRLRSTGPGSPAQEPHSLSVDSTTAATAPITVLPGTSVQNSLQTPTSGPHRALSLKTPPLLQGKKNQSREKSKAIKYSHQFKH